MTRGPACWPWMPRAPSGPDTHGALPVGRGALRALHPARRAARPGAHPAAAERRGRPVGGHEGRGTGLPPRRPAHPAGFRGRAVGWQGPVAPRGGGWLALDRHGRRHLPVEGGAAPALHRATRGCSTSGPSTCSPDGRGNLWMSGNKGIFRVLPGGAGGVAVGRRERVTSRLYGTEDGMRSEECNGLGAPAGLRARDGRLWFPTIRGAVVYTPEHEQQRLPPSSRAHRGAPGGWPPGAALRVGPHLRGGRSGSNSSYTAAGLRAPRRLRFRYQLEGIDAELVEAGAAARGLLYPPASRALPLPRGGGVRGRRRRGPGRGGGALPATPLPPDAPRSAWRACWPPCCWCAGGVWLRLRRSRQRERQLQDRVDQRTAELATLNADLKARLEELQATRERLVHAEKMAAVGTLAAGVGHEINNPLAFIISNLHYVACGGAGRGGTRGGARALGGGGAGALRGAPGRGADAPHRPGSQDVLPGGAGARAAGGAARGCWTWRCPSRTRRCATAPGW